MIQEGDKSFRVSHQQEQSQVIPSSQESSSDNSSHQAGELHNSNVSQSGTVLDRDIIKFILESSKPDHLPMGGPTRRSLPIDSSHK